MGRTFDLWWSLSPRPDSPMIEMFTAKSGAPSLKVNGVALHSPYDPEKEARRFVEQALGKETPSVVIVLGEGAGHISRAAAEAFPGVPVITVVYSAEIARTPGLPGLPRQDAWDPSCAKGLEEYLRTRVEELQVEGLRVIEWPPSSRAFPDQSRGANEAVRRVVQELNGSFVTTVAAGRLWLRNCFSNFLHLDEILDAPRRPQGRPILLAAPGPSLEDAAGVMETVRDRTALWALPSSCPFLMARGLVPDLVVMTDPGFYALHHLQFAAPPCPIVMPLSAARGTWALRPRPPVMLLEQPFLVERTLLAAAGIKAPSVPPHGTVTATALELALAYTSGPVVVAGLDLGSRDLLSHARPNAFDTLLHLEVSRLQPHLAQWFTRDTLSGAAAVPGLHGFRNTPALRTYAGWLDSGFQSARSRLFRLLPSPAELSSMTALDGPAFARLLAPFAPDSAGSPRTPMAGWPAPGARRATAGRLLEQWLHAVMEATGALHGGGVNLSAYPLVLDLAHLVSPRRLVDVLRKSRRGDLQGAGESALEALDDCARFLQGLAEKVRA